MARWMVDLPASLGPRMIVGRATGRYRVRDSAAGSGRAAGGSSQRDLVAGQQQAAEAKGVAQFGGLGRVVGAWAPGRPSSAAIRASRSRMNAPAIVSGDGSVPSVMAGMETSRTRTLRNERDRAVSTSSVSMSSSSGRTPTSRTSRTRSGSALAVSVETSVGWLEMPLASSSSFSNVVAPTVRSSTFTVRVGPSVEHSMRRTLPARSWSRATASGAPA